MMFLKSAARPVGLSRMSGHRLARWLVFITLCLAGLCAGLIQAKLHATEGDSASSASPGSLVPEELDLWLSAITINRSLVQGRDDGLTQSGMVITMEMKDEDAFTFHQVRNVELTQALTAAGETLRLRDTTTTRNQLSNILAVRLHFPEPREPASRIAQLTGTMEVLARPTNPRYVSLGPIADVRGKTVRLPDYDNARVTIGWMQDGTFAIRHDNELGGRFMNNPDEERGRPRNAPFAIYDAQGNLLSYPRPHRQQRASETQYLRMFRNIDPPGDGYFEIALIAADYWVQVPINFQNVLLPQFAEREPAEPEADESEQP